MYLGRLIVALILKTVQLRPVDRRMKRKARGQEVAAVVHFCPERGWESGPCRTLAETRRKPAHECHSGPGPLFAAARV